MGNNDRLQQARILRGAHKLGSKPNCCQFLSVGASRLTLRAPKGAGNQSFLPLQGESSVLG